MSEKDNMKEYLCFMHEIVLRLEAIDDLFSIKTNISLMFFQEYAYLHFRFICELIALGCLHVHIHNHLDLNNNKIKDEFNAERIITNLLRKNPYAFPKKVKLELIEKDNKKITSISVDKNSMSVEEFKKLYSECGAILHKGKMKKAVPVFIDDKNDYDRILEWRNKLVDFLDIHTIEFEHKKGFYIINMKDDGKYPSCNIFDINEINQIDLKRFNLKMNTSKK